MGIRVRFGMAGCVRGVRVGGWVCLADADFVRRRRGEGYRGMRVGGWIQSFLDLEVVKYVIKSAFEKICVPPTGAQCIVLKRKSSTPSRAYCPPHGHQAQNPTLHVPLWWDLQLPQKEHNIRAKCSSTLFPRAALAPAELHGWSSSTPMAYPAPRVCRKPFRNSPPRLQQRDTAQGKSKQG